MNEKKCIPKHCQHRFHRLVAVSILVSLFSIVLGSIYFGLVYNIINGIGITLNIKTVGSIIILSFVLILGTYAFAAELMKKTWIEIRDFDFRISKFIRWRVIPFKDISSYNTKPNADIEIKFEESTILLQFSDLDEYYELFLSKLKDYVEN